MKYMFKFASPLPWSEKDYKEISEFKEYNQNTLPDWENIKFDPRFKGIKVKILNYIYAVSFPTLKNYRQNFNR